MEEFEGGRLEYNTGFIGGLYIREFGPANKGYVHKGHAHYIDHAMFVESGSVLVKWTNGGESGEAIFHAPNFVPVKAEAHHEITALKDGTKWRCIFSEAEGRKKSDAEGIVPFDKERWNV